jgi:uncharacterized protein (TIGR03083 family)
VAAGTSSPSVAPLCDSLVAASGRLATMLRRDPDPSAPSIGVWTLGETAAHVSSSSAYFLAVARGQVVEPEDLDHVDRSNAARLAADPERTPRILADRLEQGEEELVAYARSVDGDPIVRPFVGVDLPLSSVLAIELGELLVHGDDIARAARRSWRIARDDAALTLEGFLPLLPFVVDERRAQDVVMRCELRIRGGSRAVVVIDHGALRVESPSPAPVDHRLSVDPATFLLLMFQRVGMLRSIARGKVCAWGRRPWRAMTLRSVLKTI